jgi:hypothetical protein
MEDNMEKCTVCKKELKYIDWTSKAIVEHDTQRFGSDYSPIPMRLICRNGHFHKQVMIGGMVSSITLCDVLEQNYKSYEVKVIFEKESIFIVDKHGNLRYRESPIKNLKKGLNCPYVPFRTDSTDPIPTCNINCAKSGYDPNTNIFSQYCSGAQERHIPAELEED